MLDRLDGFEALSPSSRERAHSVALSGDSGSGQNPPMLLVTSPQTVACSEHQYARLMASMFGPWREVRASGSQ